MLKITRMLKNVLRKFDEKIGDKGFDNWKQSTNTHKKSSTYQKPKKH